MELNQNHLECLALKLNDLKSKFDKLLADGEIFANVRIIYSEIKQLESYLKSFEPHIEKSSYKRQRNHITSPSISKVDQPERISGVRSRSYRHIDDPPSIL